MPQPDHVQLGRNSDGEHEEIAYQLSSWEGETIRLRVYLDLAHAGESANATVIGYGLGFAQTIGD